jgi:hypothetical protein
MPEPINTPTRSAFVSSMVNPDISSASRAAPTA